MHWTQVFAKLVHQDLSEDEKSEEEVDEGPLWFTSLSDFKPLTFKYLTGRYSSAYFACAIKTGEHYILKQFEKGEGCLEVTALHINLHHACCS